MNIALILFLLITILYLFINLILACDKEKKDNVFLNISFILLLFVLFLRAPYSDMKTYISAFYRFNTNPFIVVQNNRLEWGYKILNLFIGKIWTNERFFMFIVDILTCIGPYSFIKKYSKNYYLSVLLYISIGTYSMNFYLIRQAIAISILLFSIQFIEKRKLIIFSIFVLLASLFHKSAIIFWLLYFLSNDFLKKDNDVLFVLATFVLFLFRKEVCYYITRLFYSQYIGTAYAVSGVGYGRLALFFVLLLFCLIFNIKQISKDTIIMLRMSQMATLIQILASVFAIICRLASYFYMGFIILPVNVIVYLKDKKLRIIVSFITTITILIYIYCIVPIDGYSFFWIN